MSLSIAIIQKNVMLKIRNKSDISKEDLEHTASTETIPSSVSQITNPDSSRKGSAASK